MLLGKDKPDPFEVYNDYNSNLVNLFLCRMRDRPAELIRELGFLPLNSREEFNAWKKFFEKEEFNDQHVSQELEALDELWGEKRRQSFRPSICTLCRTVRYGKPPCIFKLIRYSYASAGRSFGRQPFSISSVFPLIQDVAKRLEHVVIENQDFEVLIRHYDRPDSFFYCDPPYFDSEYIYDAPFSWEDHQRLNRVLGQAQGKWLLSYNDCEEIRELYRGYALFDFQRVHTMGQRFDAGRASSGCSTAKPRHHASARQFVLLCAFFISNQNNRRKHDETQSPQNALFAAGCSAALGNPAGSVGHSAAGGHRAGCGTCAGSIHGPNERRNRTNRGISACPRGDGRTAGTARRGNTACGCSG